MGLVLKPHLVEGNSQMLDVISQQNRLVEWAGMFLQRFLISKNQISLLYLHRVHWVHLGAHNAASVWPLMRLPISSGWCILCFVYNLVLTMKEIESTHSGSQTAKSKWWLSLVVGEKKKSLVSKVTWNRFIFVWKQSLSSVCSVSLFTKPLFSVWANHQPLWSYFHWPNLAEALPPPVTVQLISNNIPQYKTLSCVVYILCTMFFHI